MDDGGFDSEHNAKISWRHFLHQNSEWSGTLFTKPDKIDHQKQPGLWADGTRAKEATGMRETHEPGTYYVRPNQSPPRPAAASLCCWRLTVRTAGLRSTTTCA